jgi:hypothetical protein
MARRRDDSVKAGCGIDGKLGENFTKGGSDPWNPPTLTDDLTDKGSGAYTRNDHAGLRQKLPAEAATRSRDIFDDVTANQPDSGNRAVKSRG